MNVTEPVSVRFDPKMEKKTGPSQTFKHYLYLTRFDFDLIHKSGSSMGKADALSRRPDHKEGVELDNENITLLKPSFFKIQALQQGHLLINGDEEEILIKI